MSSKSSRPRHPEPFGARSRRELSDADLFWRDLDLDEAPSAESTPPAARGTRQSAPRGVRQSAPRDGSSAADEVEGCGERAEILDRFGYDSPNLTPSHRAAVDRVARAIDASQGGGSPVITVCVRGHTDASGDANYNRQLGQRRAASVETALRRRLDALRPGLSARLTFRTTSAGESRPVASNATADGMAQNRRVEVLFGRRQEAAVVMAQAAGSPSEGHVEGLFAFGGVASWSSETTPSDPFVVAVGSAGLGLIGTGTPEPGTYFWSTASPAMARVSPTTEPEGRPNRALVLGLSPGRTQVRLRYRTSPSHAGSPPQEAMWQGDLVVARASFAGLVEPPGRACAGGPSELVRPVSRSGGVARRGVVVQLEPADFWAGKEVEWTFTAQGAQRGAMPPGVSNLDASPGFGFTAATRRSVIAADGRAAVRVHMPPVSLNRGRLVATPVGHPGLAVTIDLEVPGVVVLDAGHGGTANVAGSSSNNAQGVTSGVLEKAMTLDMVLRARDALLGGGRLVHVHLTRDADFNVPGADRAGLARFRGADVLVSVHFNGSSSQAARGTSTFVRADANGNVNRAEDLALAQRVQQAVFGAIPGGRDRGVHDDTATQHPTGLAVLSDTTFGNTAALHPIRACLLEVEFITNPTVDAAFNTDANRETLRQNIASAIARAILEDLENQP